MSTANVIWKKVAGFLRLSEDATETEADMALENAGGFQGIVDSAVSAAVNELTEKMNGVSARLDTLEKESADLKAQLSEREQRISDLTAEIETARAAATKAAADYEAAQKQVTELYGQVASLKAGVQTQQQDGDDKHAALSITRAQTPGAPIPIVSEELKKMTGRK